jgi:hypothetical protein
MMNIAVTWGLCRQPAWHRPAMRISPHEGAQSWWRANAVEPFPPDRELIEVMQWKRFANRHWAMSTFTHHADRFESGCPLYAMERSHWRHFASNTFEDRDALTLAPWLGNALHTRCLPLQPIWPGFAINTIFYAAMLWVVFTAPGALRRRRRRFRGLCIHCGYDLRGQPAPPDGSSIKCPECGRSP